jgi:hypothetical protein
MDVTRGDLSSFYNPPGDIPVSKFVSEHVCGINGM